MQCRTTKFIFNNCYASAINQTLRTHIFEIQDILFAVKSLASPTRNFNDITFSQGDTRSSAHNKLKHHLHTGNSNRNSYFHRLPGLWNALPVIDINLSTVTIKEKLKNYTWNYFVDYFDDDNHFTYHYLCPCSKFHDHSLSSNFQSSHCICNLCIGLQAQVACRPLAICHKVIINK